MKLNTYNERFVMLIVRIRRAEVANMEAKRIPAAMRIFTLALTDAKRLFSQKRKYLTNSIRLRTSGPICQTSCLHGDLLLYSIGGFRNLLDRQNVAALLLVTNRIGNAVT